MMIFSGRVGKCIYIYVQTSLYERVLPTRLPDQVYSSPRVAGYVNGTLYFIFLWIRELYVRKLKYCYILLKRRWNKKNGCTILRVTPPQLTQPTTIPHQHHIIDSHHYPRITIYLHLKPHRGHHARTSCQPPLYFRPRPRTRHLDRLGRIPIQEPSNRTRSRHARIGLESVVCIHLIRMKA